MYVIIALLSEREAINSESMRWKPVRFREYRPSAARISELA